MPFNLNPWRAFAGAALGMLLCSLSSCAVYTIDRTQLENTLLAREACCKAGGLNKLLSTYKVQYSNHMDSISYFDQNGSVRKRKLRYDTRLRVVTKKHGSLWLYAKTLYIWRGEYLVGERSEVRLKKTGYLPVPLCEIERIEVRG